VPRPQVIGPITGGAHGRPFTSSPLPVKPAGYLQQEFFLSGTATGYLPVGKWRSNGRWTAKPAETAPYETRILVRRPASPAKFNGTVVVEWLNVSFQADVDPDYLYESQQLLKQGYAWVGVSAQQLGVQGNTGNNPLCFLLGTTTPLTSRQLAKLYPNHAVYVLAVEHAAAQDVRAGFLLPGDALEIGAAAAASEIGLPPPTG
jgi:Alpha/beta hydrolase domain